MSENNDIQNNQQEVEDVLPDDAYAENLRREQERDNKIFEELCPEEKYISATTCHICDKKAKILGKLKNCCFCGMTVCGDCSPKERKDPQSEEFYRICDFCDEKYLKRDVLQDIYNQEAEYDKQIEEMENKQEQLQKLLKTYDQQKKELNQQLTDDTQKFQNELQDLETKIEEKNKGVEEYEKAERSIQAEIDELEQNQMKEKEEHSMLVNQNNQINEEVEKYQKEIARYEELISIYKQNNKDVLDEMENLDA